MDMNVKYTPQEIPIKVIKRMLKEDSWKNSLEEEEVLYNLENGLYSKQYVKKVKNVLEANN